MILTKEVEITINSANFKHFKSLGYENLKNRNKIIVPVEHLNKGSHSIIKVKCDFCGKEKELIYRYYNKEKPYACSKCGGFNLIETNLNKFGAEYYSQTVEFKENCKKTCMEKYGVDNVSKVESVKKKRKNTMLDKYKSEFYFSSVDFYKKYEKTSMLNYGTPHPMMSDKMKKIKEKYYIENGYNILTDEFDIYKRKIYRLTYKIKKELLESWDGYDYYDKEYIRNNFSLPYHDKNYPTIDHKISIFDGFKNKIEPEKIADKTNLCFTKRNLNSKKYKNSYFIP